MPAKDKLLISPAKVQAGRPAQQFREFVGELRLTVVFMIVLAALLMPVQGFGFWFNLGYALAIGLSIHTLSFLICLARNTAMDWKTSVVAIPLGTGVGLTIGSLINDSNPMRLVGEHPTTLLIGLAVSLIVGTAISYYFYSRGVIAEAAAARQQDQLERIARERELAEANLRLLQAQIEPHFLFNTLSNVLSLIHGDAAKAERMLEDFIAYLRLSLRRTRASTVTLADELSLVRTYLDIQAIRMGSRLAYTIDTGGVPLDLPLPPFLIQPLVENAVVHGLEPSAEGGELSIRISQHDSRLVVEVADTGLGLSPRHSPGVGLGSVRERLEVLFPQQAAFALTANQPQGTVARFEIPVLG
jgi:signal transduction histidine kinase